MIAVITPQFENTEYSVPEDGGSVEICIAVQPDQLEREVVVTLQTVDDTATGILSNVIYLILSELRIIIYMYFPICHQNLKTTQQ